MGSGLTPIPGRRRRRSRARGRGTRRPRRCSRSCRPWGRSRGRRGAGQVGEADRGAVVGLQGEVGGRLPGLESRHGDLRRRARPRLSPGGDDRGGATIGRDGDTPPAVVRRGARRTTPTSRGRDASPRRSPTSTGRPSAARRRAAIAGLMRRDIDARARARATGWPRSRDASPARCTWCWPTSAAAAASGRWREAVGWPRALRAMAVLSLLGGGRVRRDEAYIDELGVAGWARRRGVGGALLGGLRAEARRAGRRRLTLWVTIDNAPARRALRGLRVPGVLAPRLAAGAHGVRLARAPSSWRSR